MIEKNSWGNIRLLCACHDKDQPEMTISQGPHSMFYSCPKYHDPNGKSCNNRLTFIDYEALLKHITEIGSGDDGLVEHTITSHTWRNKGVEYKVGTKNLKTGRIDVSVKNIKAMARI